MILGLVLYLFWAGGDNCFLGLSLDLVERLAVVLVIFYFFRLGGVEPSGGSGRGNSFFGRSCLALIRWLLAGLALGLAL